MASTARFSTLGAPGWTAGAVGLAANTTKTLTAGTVGTDIFLVHTVAAGALGQLIFSVGAKPAGTNVATVCRLWMNNGLSTPGTGGTAAHNLYLDDLPLPASTLSETTAMQAFVLPLRLKDWPPNYRLYATFGTAVAAGYFLSTDAHQL
jgi:hypothetical protein